MTTAWLMPLSLPYVGTPATVLQALELATLTDANALLQAAEKRSADLLQSARERQRCLMAQWRAQARYQARASLQDAVRDMQQGVAQWQKAMESALADFAAVCVHKLLDDSGAHAALEQRAIAIARSLIDSGPVEISVAPSVARLVRAALQDAGLAPGTASGVHVREDASLAPADVMAMTPAHTVDGRLSHWLQDVHAAALRAVASTDVAA